MKVIKFFLFFYLISFSSNAQVWKEAGNYVWHGPVYSIYSDSFTNHLIVGGLFDSVGNVPAHNIAEWDGISWLPLGNGLDNGVGFNSITVYNGEIYATSSIYLNDFNIYKWDGSTWSIFATASYSINVLKTFNNKLYVGGDFYTIDGIILNGLGVWNGIYWSSVGGGIPSANGGEIRCIEFDDNSNLYIGGIFEQIGTVTFNNIAKWDGTSWTQLTTGIIASIGVSVVNSLKFWNNNLYVGGSFNTAGGIPCSHIAKWNGNMWSGLGSGIYGDPRAFEVYNNKLYSAGEFAGTGGSIINGVVFWDGNDWINIDDGSISELFGLQVFNDELYACNYSSDSNNFKMVARYSDLNFETQVTQCNACNGSATVTPVGVPPQTYLWSNGETTQTATALCAGTYTVTVTDASGSPSIGTVTIDAPPAIQLIPTITDASCATCSDGSLSLAVTGGSGVFSFLWGTGDTANAISNLLPGVYAVTVTDSLGCSVTNNYAVSYLVLSLFETHSDDVCGNCTGSIDVTVTNGTAPYQYLWNTTQTGEDINNLCAGTYDVTVTDFNGTTSTISITISNTNGPTLSETHTDATCQQANGSIDVITNGGTSPCTYAWSNGATTEDLINLDDATYMLTVTDANGCTGTIAVTINTTNGPVITSVSANATNGNNNGSVDLTITGGTPPFNFLWSNSATTEDISNLAAAVYCVTVTDGAGCTIIHCDTVSTINSVSSIADENNVTVYPNPFTNELIIKSPLSIINSIQVTDVTGREIYHSYNNQKSQIINFKSAVSGLYLLKLTDADGNVTVKKVVKE